MKVTRDGYQVHIIHDHIGMRPIYILGLPGDVQKLVDRYLKDIEVVPE